MNNMISTQKNAIKSQPFPEILSPAGSLEKLKVAVDYGADAVYVGALKFGLRSAAQNFTDSELLEGIDYAHSKQVKVYIVLNGFLHDEDLDELKSYLNFLEKAKPDAAIISDIGVIKLVSSLTTIPIHLSTQASCVNSESAKFWKSLGCERVVLGRETSIEEAKKIKELAQIEVEMFIHGSMCMAYSGNCVISNFTQGRDSNRGGCAHSCRFEYSLDMSSNAQKKSHLDKLKELKAFFMSSTDLNGLRLLEKFIDAGIDSLKIEGRMKSNLYAATVTKVYSEALNYYKKHGHFLSDDLYLWEEELRKINHRSYESANLEVKAGASTIFDEREHSEDTTYKVVGKVIEVYEQIGFILFVQNAFNQNDILEILPFIGPGIKFKVNSFSDLNDDECSRSRPSTLVKILYEDLEYSTQCREQNLHAINKDMIVRMECL